MAVKNEELVENSTPANGANVQAVADAANHKFSKVSAAVKQAGEAGMIRVRVAGIHPQDLTGKIIMGADGNPITLDADGQDAIEDPGVEIYPVEINESKTLYKALIGRTKGLGRSTVYLVPVSACTMPVARQSTGGVKTDDDELTTAAKKAVMLIETMHDPNIPGTITLDQWKALAAANVKAESVPSDVAAGKVKYNSYETWKKTFTLMHNGQAPGATDCAAQFPGATTVNLAAAIMAIHAYRADRATKITLAQGALKVALDAQALAATVNGTTPEQLVNLQTAVNVATTNLLTAVDAYCKGKSWEQTARTIYGACNG